MTTGMPALFTFQQLTAWHSRLTDTWQRVELGENTDDGFPLPKTCHKRRWNPGDAGLNFKTIVGQHLLQFGRTARFKVPQFCVVPEFQGKAVELFAVLIYIPQ